MSSQVAGKVHDPNTGTRDSPQRLTLSRIKVQVLTTAVTIGTTPTPLPATPLTDRVSLSVQNTASVKVYLGGANVNTTNGFQLTPFSDRDYPIDDTATLYACVATGTATIVVEETV